MTRRIAAVPAVLTLCTLLSGPTYVIQTSIVAKVHEVRLSANRFVPDETIARAGDTVRFINGGGGPHNIQFFVDSLSESARSLLERAMPGDKIGPVASPLLLDQNETYQFELPALPAGRYPYVCLPHSASNMRGALVVVP
jgi:plastocyanin